MAKDTKTEQGAPTPPPAPKGPAARVCEQGDRAPGDGVTKRYKLRPVNCGGTPYKYVLAGSADDAKACYVAAMGAALEKPKDEPIEWYCTELPD